MAVPPELMALLQGGGGAPPGMDPAMGGGAPPEEEAGPSALYGGGGLGGDNTESLRAALDALAAYSEGEDDEQNIQIVLKCVTALQAILAEEQKMVDGAMGGKADPRALRKLGGAGGAGGGPQY
jgi:hypothetical protein